MKNNHTITVGIPVFNEGLNIERLLNSIYLQKSKKTLIREIIVSSDGSSDDTVEKARRCEQKAIKLIVIDNKDRKGISRGLNQIIRRSSTDVLVTLDGDIQIRDRFFIEKLVEPIITREADFTSSATAELKPVSNVAKALAVSMNIKRGLFGSFADGNNLYTCFGLARGYSKRFYKRLNFRVSVGNDMYSYLSCLSLGLTFVNAKKATAYYRLPETFVDHEKQSTRFIASPLELTKYFNKALVKQETNIPKIAIVKTIWNAMPIVFAHPVDVVYYLWIQFNIKMHLHSNNVNQAWDMATTSKNL